MRGILARMSYRIIDGPDAQGRYKYKLRYISGGSYRTRLRWLRNDDEARRYIAAETSGAVDGLTWSTAYEIWREQDSGRSDSYLEKVRHSVSLLIDHLGDQAIDRTSAADMRSYLDRRLSDASPAAAGKCLTHFKAIANAMEERIQTPEWMRIKKPKHRPVEREAMPPELIPEYLDASTGALSPIVRWIALTGVRQQAAAQMLREDVGDEFAVMRMKGGRELRFRLDDALLSVLDLARQWRREVGYDGRYIFVTSQGNPWRDTVLSQMIRKAWSILEKKNGYRYTLHSLRHTFATVAGTSFGPDMLAAALGHESRATSERYTHVSQDQQARDTVQAAVRATIMEWVNLPTTVGKSPKTTEDEHRKT